MLPRLQASSAKQNYLAVMKVSQLALSKAAAARQKEAAKQQQRDGDGSDSDEDMLEGSDADSDEGALPTVAACLLAPHLLAVGAARPRSMRAAQVAGPEKPGWALLFAMSACPGGCWGAAQLIRAQRVVFTHEQGRGRCGARHAMPPKGQRVCCRCR